MNYEPMLPMVDGWVLWLGVLLVPLMALVAMTAFIVLYRERKTASGSRAVRNVAFASVSTLATLSVLGFMLFSGLRMEANQSVASGNLTEKYDVQSVVWENSRGLDVNPTDTVSAREILVKDAEGVDRVALFTVNTDTFEPFLEYLPVRE